MDGASEFDRLSEDKSIAIPKMDFGVVEYHEEYGAVESMSWKYPPIDFYPYCSAPLYSQRYTKSRDFHQSPWITNDL